MRRIAYAIAVTVSFIAGCSGSGWYAQEVERLRIAGVNVSQNGPPDTRFRIHDGQVILTDRGLRTMDSVRLPYLVGQEGER